MQRDTILVLKSKIYPAFGMFYDDGRPNEIRDDLPRAMVAFIYEHEQYHVNDPDIATEGMVMKELKANIHAARIHPWGAFLTILWSLAPYRLAYYWRRLKENK